MRKLKKTQVLISLFLFLFIFSAAYPLSANPIKCAISVFNMNNQEIKDFPKNPKALTTEIHLTNEAGRLYASLEINFYKKNAFIRYNKYNNSLESNLYKRYHHNANETLFKEQKKVKCLAGIYDITGKKIGEEKIESINPSIARKILINEQELKAGIRMLQRASTGHYLHDWKYSVDLRKIFTSQNQSYEKFVKIENNFYNIKKINWIIDKNTKKLNRIDIYTDYISTSEPAGQIKKTLAQIYAIDENKNPIQNKKIQITIKSQDKEAKLELSTDISGNIILPEDKRIEIMPDYTGIITCEINTSDEYLYAKKLINYSLVRASGVTIELNTLKKRLKQIKIIGPDANEFSSKPVTLEINNTSLQQFTDESGNISFNDMNLIYVLKDKPLSISVSAEKNLLKKSVQVKVEDIKDGELVLKLEQSAEIISKIKVIDSNEFPLINRDVEIKADKKIIKGKTNVFGILNLSKNLMINKGGFLEIICTIDNGLYQGYKKISISDIKYDEIYIKVYEQAKRIDSIMALDDNNKPVRNLNFSINFGGSEEILNSDVNGIINLKKGIIVNRNEDKEVSLISEDNAYIGYSKISFSDIKDNSITIILTRKLWQITGIKVFDKKSNPIINSPIIVKISDKTLKGKTNPEGENIFSENIYIKKDEALSYIIRTEDNRTGEGVITVKSLSDDGKILCIVENKTNIAQDNESDIPNIQTEAFLSDPTEDIIVIGISNSIAMENIYGNLSSMIEFLWNASENWKNKKTIWFNFANQKIEYEKKLIDIRDASVYGDLFTKQIIEQAADKIIQEKTLKDTAKLILIMPEDIGLRYQFSSLKNKLDKNKIKLGVIQIIDNASTVDYKNTRHYKALEYLCSDRIVSYTLQDFINRIQQNKNEFLSSIYKKIFNK